VCGLVVRSAVGLGRRTIPLEGGKDAVVFFLPRTSVARGGLIWLPRVLCVCTCLCSRVNVLCVCILYTF